MREVLRVGVASEEGPPEITSEEHRRGHGAEGVGEALLRE